MVDRRKMILIISGMVGLVTAYAYAARLQGLRDDITRMSDLVGVITATRTIQAGETLAPEDMTGTMVPRSLIPARSVGAQDAELVVGRRLFHPVPEGDPILWTDFPEGPRSANPTEMIQPGYRAIALPADETHTLAHFINPGDVVDILASSFGSGQTRLTSEIVARDIPVLAVGRRISLATGADRDVEYPLSVTLMVDQGTAVRILRASLVGEIQFLARGSHPLAGLDDPGFGATRTTEGVGR